MWIVSKVERFGGMSRQQEIRRHGTNYEEKHGLVAGPIKTVTLEKPKQRPNCFLVHLLLVVVMPESILGPSQACSTLQLARRIEFLFKSWSQRFDAKNSYLKC